MKVSNDNLENISALVDGELENAQATIDHLMSSEAARDIWQSMHLSKDITHSAIERKASPDFSAGVMSAIANEPVILRPKAKQSTVTKNEKAVSILPFFRPVAGFAIAATVAAVTILSFDNISSPSPVPSSSALATLAPNASPSIVPVAFTGTYDASDRTYWQGSDEGMQDELNRYLVDHTEHSNPGGYPSMVPYVRVAGYDSH